MIHIGQIDRAWEQGPVVIRPLRSLTQQAVAAVNNAIPAVPGTWAVEQHDDYDGYLSVLVSPEGDHEAPAYLISGQLGRIELAQLRNDELQTLGQFERIEAAVTELIATLSRSETAE